MLPIGKTEGDTTWPPRRVGRRVLGLQEESVRGKVRIMNERLLLGRKRGWEFHLLPRIPRRYSEASLAGRETRQETG